MSSSNNMTDRLEIFLAKTLAWKKESEIKNRYYEAIVIIDNEDADINQYTIELLPQMMKEHRYQKVYVLSSDKELLNNIKLSYEEYVEIEYCEHDFLVDFNKVQAFTKMFNRVYTNLTEYNDDFNPLLMEGVNSITRREIVGRVFLGIKNYYSKRVDSSFYSLPKERVPIDWVYSRKHVPVDKNSTVDVRCYYRKRIKELEEGQLIDNDSVIVIYGECNGAHIIAKELKDKYNYLIVDRSYKKIGKEINDEIINDAKKILEKHNSNYRIFVTIYHYQEVCEYLKYYGYELGKEVFIFNYKKDINDYEDDEISLYVKKKFENGEKMYNNLRQRFGERSIFLSPFYASGDIYLASLYIPYYVEKKEIKSFIVVVSSRAASKIAKLCGYDVCVISKEDAFCLLDYARLMGYANLDVHFINVASEEQRVINLFSRVDINSMHQRLAFEDDVKRSIPKISQINSDVIFEENSLRKGRTVIISPYSNTEGNIPEDMCERLIRILRDNDFDICTNVAPEERALHGTKGLFIPYSQIIDFVNKAGFFIGVRSGLCDIISSTTSKMIIFYKERDRVVYDLKEMGLKEIDILQYNFEEVEDNSEEIFKQIEEFVS